VALGVSAQLGREPKGATSVELALKTNFSTQKLDQEFANGQSEPSAAVGTGD
jgi:hypothetical protein